MMFTSAFLLALSPLAALAHSSSHHHSLSKRDAHIGKRAVQTVDDADTSSIKYSGKWTHGSVNGGDTLSWTNSANASYSFSTPKGAKGVSIKSTLKNDRGAFKVLMDGKVVGNGTTHGGAGLKLATAETASQVVWQTNITDKAAHKFEVVKTSGKGVYLSVDEVEIAGVKATTSSLNGYFYGANNYYAYSMAQKDRLELLDAMKSAGMQYLRIFITHVGADSKGSNSIDVPDVEPSTVGKYDDTILESIDQLMSEASERGIKLLLAMHDRYALGFWGTDAYAYHFGVVNGGEGAQEIADASAFYTSGAAKQAIDNRITHILEHKNSKMGNKAYKDLSEGIFAVEAENEPQGHMDLADPNWVCDRSKHIKSILGENSGIIVTTGGGITFDESSQDWNTKCDAVDYVSAHDYGTDSGNAVSALKSIAQKSGKPVFFEEWGASGGSKGQIMSSMVGALKGANIPWSVWQVTNPGNPGDFETWTSEQSAWNALASGGHAKRSDEPTKPLAVRKFVRRSQASKRNSRPVEVVA